MKFSEPNRPAAQTGIKVHDILYILFKHKWKIIILSLIGFGLAGGLAYRYDSISPSYETRAELLVRYVVERNAGDPDASSSIRGAGPMEVMNTELEILKSFNVALDTAKAMGPDKIMPASKKPPSVVDAAGYLTGHLGVEAQLGSNIIQLSYRDRDPDRAVKVLGQIIQCYFARHLAIHRSTTAFDQVSVQTDQARSTLRITENEINQLKAKSGVLSIAGTITEFESRRQLIRSTLMSAEAALAEQRAKVTALEKFAASGGSEPHKAAVTGAGGAAAEVAPTREEQEQLRQTAQALAEFKDLTVRLEMLRQERNRTLLRRSASDPMIVSLDRQIVEVESRKFDLSKSYPNFTRRVEVPGQPVGPVRSLEDEMALQTAMEARVAATEQQSKDIEKEVEGLSALGFKLEDLERRRQMEEEKFRYYQSSLEKARVDETLDPTKMPNIGIVQDPSSPVKSIDVKAMKWIMGIAASGVAVGLACAFLIERVIDRRVSLPSQIRSRLQLPLMLSIPYVRSKDGLAQLIGSTDPLEPPPLPGSSLALAANGKVTRRPSKSVHFIEPFAAAIHDRVVFNFEINNITHKPKLVALTGLSEGAGTSTIATGLAKSFSEGNRKVLLVDLNPSLNHAGVVAEPRNSLRRSLEISRTEEFRQSSQNLYFASATTRRFQGDSFALAPLGLREILPSLVSSDYDYIIFDMPPVDSTSPTVAMAGFMDKVLLVLDANNTTPDRLKWAFSELEKGRADVSCIFNKVKSHAPRWVEGDL